MCSLKAKAKAKAKAEAVAHKSIHSFSVSITEIPKAESGG